MPPRRSPRPTLAALASGAGVEHQLTGSTLAVHADTFSWMPSGSVDLVLTDPPFNIARDTNFHTYESNRLNSFRFDSDKGWDSYTDEEFLALMSSWADEFHRVLRPGGSFAIFCADSYVSHLIDALRSSGLRPRRTVTWRKPNAMPANRKSMMMSACEYVVVGVKGGRATFNADLLLDDLSALVEVEAVLVADKVASVIEKAVRSAMSAVEATGEERPAAVEAAVAAAVASAIPSAVDRVSNMYAASSDDAVRYLRGCVPNYVSFPSTTGKRIHPTEKPVPVLRYLTGLFSRPGDLVLDPFAGSGSAGEAAGLMGRDVVLVERDLDFYPRLRDRMVRVSAGPGTA